MLSYVKEGSEAIKQKLFAIPECVDWWSIAAGLVIRWGKEKLQTIHFLPQIQKLV